MSTKQTVMPYVTDVGGCAGCKFHDPHLIFELCTHEKSEYRSDGRGRKDHHTMQHMREQHAGACGANKALFSAA